jgi:hypothetical protein
MQLEGNILKMRAEFATPVNYFLQVGQNEIMMNDLIGKKISMNFTGQINCISCGKQTKTSFGQGFCYNCLQTAPEASESVMRPELSKAHLGFARDMEWAQKHDLIDHHVYLAVSGDVKVGVTRHHQIPTRWIDQGASAAIKVATTPNRHIAGIIEVFLKKYFTDKTDWRAMLKNEIAENINLLDEKQKVYQLLPSELKKYFESDNEVIEIDYPVLSFPQTIKSIGFDKTPKIEGILTGIKGQYLIFQDESVLNIRKHNGYFLQIKSLSSYSILEHQFR